MEIFRPFLHLLLPICKKKKKKKYSWNAWILNRKLTDRDIRIFIFNIDRKYSLEQLLKQIIKKQFNNKK